MVLVLASQFLWECYNIYHRLMIRESPVIESFWYIRVIPRCNTDLECRIWRISWRSLDTTGCVRQDRHECDIKVFTFIYVRHLVRLEFRKETQCKIYIGYTHMVLVSVSLLWRQGWHIHHLVIHESPVIQWVLDISQSFHMATQIWVNVCSGNGLLLDAPSHYRNKCWLVELYEGALWHSIWCNDKKCTSDQCAN